MTIRRGEPWGEQAAPPAELVVVSSDADAAESVIRQRAAGRQPTIGLGRGDLARTLGGGIEGRFSGTVVRAPVDILRVEAGGRTTYALAHVVARRSWWRGELYAAMNAQFIGGYDVAPRSHPNDGRLDVVHVDPAMTMRMRWQARRRARNGTHVPHPHIATKQVEADTVCFVRPLQLWVDGRRWERASSVTITVEPDALTVYA